MSATGFVRVAVVVGTLAFVPALAAAESLPRFTEEREAAALHFVRKHCPELVPLLDELKKTRPAAYELQIRETFQVTELLADLQDDPKRHELELKLWKAENRSLVLVARLATSKDDERKAIEDQLQAIAKELVELEVRSLEYRVQLLEREATNARDELTKARDNLDKSVKDRYESLLEKAKRKRVP
jgi:hypothetical protein